MVEAFKSIAVGNYIPLGFPQDRFMVPRLKFAYGAPVSQWSDSQIGTLWSITGAQQLLKLTCVLYGISMAGSSR
jgi:hypothetical protein